MKFVILILIILQFFSCGRWKTTKLKPDHLCSIKPGLEAGNIKLNFDKYNIVDNSYGIYIQNGYIYTSDNILKRVSMLDMSGNPQLIIGKKDINSLTNKDIKKSYFNFSTIGLITSDSDENIYVQNRFTSTVKQKNIESNKKLGFSPSYILVFDKDGNLLYTLGKRGSPDIPFGYIENLFIDNQDRLFVITRSYNTWEVYIFQNKKRKFNFNFDEIDFKEGSEEKKHIGKIENLKVFRDGTKLLISVAYYLNAEFRTRKIYNFSIKKKKIDKTIMTIYDHENELFSMFNDKYIYLWDISDKNIKFIISNFDGNTINNIVLRLPDKYNYFNDVIIDENEHLYTYHVDKTGIDIIQWR